MGAGIRWLNPFDNLENHIPVHGQFIPLQWKGSSHGEATRKS
jgi:hypothetical protein